MFSGQQTTAGIIEKLASAAEGSQDMSLENVETIANGENGLL